MEDPDILNIFNDISNVQKQIIWLEKIFRKKGYNLLFPSFFSRPLNISDSFYGIRKEFPEIPTVIEVVSQSDDFDLESNTGNLAEQLRSLSFYNWMEMFQLIMKNLHFLLQRIQALYQVMDDTLEVAAGYIANINTDENFHRCHTLHLMETEVMISEQDYLKIKPNLKDVLCSVCDHAHDCCAKILSAKAKDGSLDKVIMAEFFSLAKSIEEFQQKSEDISGKQSTALRLALQSQVSRFVMRFHEERKVKL
ncbi:hypothetical protein AVEN_209585-1, partial [Araneus ventricosus]